MAFDAWIEWIELVNAVGLSAKQMDPLDLFLIAGKILREVPRPGGLEAIQAMTPAERIRLRDKVAGVAEFPGAKK